MIFLFFRFSLCNIQLCQVSSFRNLGRVGGFFDPPPPSPICEQPRNSPWTWVGLGEENGFFLKKKSRGGPKGKSKLKCWDTHSKRNAQVVFLCYLQKSGASWTYSTFPQIIKKKTIHGHISLTGHIHFFQLRQENSVFY